MPNIKVLSGGGFPEREVNSTTVGALREELSISSDATVAVNGRGVTDNYELQNDDIVAAVSSDKKGGEVKVDTFKVSITSHRNTLYELQ